MPKKEVYSQEGDVTAEDGVVHWDGPNGVDVGLTPDAAFVTSDRSCALRPELPDNVG